MRIHDCVVFPWDERLLCLLSSALGERLTNVGLASDQLDRKISPVVCSALVPCILSDKYVLYYHYIMHIMLCHIIIVNVMHFVT